jgi:hypothetical protein
MKTRIAPSNLPRALWLAAGAFVLAGLVASLAWAIATLASRPLDGVEGEVLFEAERMARGLPLYVDPAIGAREYGAVPARYLVLYPPVWSALLSRLPGSLAAQSAVARAAATVAWLGALAWIAWRAQGERRRRAAAAGAAFVASVFTLTLFGASARPDALAVALAGVALERASRRSSEDGAARVDWLAGALFALAAWVKPNVLGAAPGAFAAAAMWTAARARAGSGAARSARPSRPVRARARSVVAAVAPGVAGAAVVSLAIGGVLTAETGRAWIEHLLLSTGQAPSLSHWLEQLASRAPFFALPIGVALAVGWRARDDAGAAIATGALATSAAWCLLSLAKIGSASNYLMEPCVAGVVVLARADLPRPRSALVAAALALAQVAWDDVASVRSAIERVPRDRAAASLVANARLVCGADPGDVVIADEPGLELMVDRRVVQTPFQSTHLARRGLFSIDAWRADVTSPEVACVLMQDDLLDRPLDAVDVEHDRFPVELRRALRETFVKVGERGGIFVYRRREAR